MYPVTYGHRRPGPDFVVLISSDSLVWIRQSSPKYKKNSETTTRTARTTETATGRTLMTTETATGRTLIMSEHIHFATIPCYQQESRGGEDIVDPFKTLRQTVRDEAEGRHQLRLAICVGEMERGCLKRFRQRWRCGCLELTSYRSGVMV